MIGVRDTTSLKQIARIWSRDGGGLDAIAIGKIRGVSGLSTFFASMSASASVPPTGYSNSGSAADTLTGNSFCTVEGGVAPFTYLWEEVSASGVWTIVSPASSLTGFIASAVDPIDTRTATFKCTVTDANGEIAASNTIEATAVNIGGGF